MKLVKVRTRNRKCDYCGEGYWRVNKMSLWTRRNPGHRIGWSKTIAKLCNECFSLRTAERSLMVMALRIVKGDLFKVG